MTGLYVYGNEFQSFVTTENLLTSRMNSDRWRYNGTNEGGNEFVEWDVCVCCLFGLINWRLVNHEALKVDLLCNRIHRLCDSGYERALPPWYTEESVHKRVRSILFQVGQTQEPVLHTLPYSNGATYLNIMLKPPPQVECNRSTDSSCISFRVEWPNFLVLVTEKQGYITQYMLWNVREWNLYLLCYYALQFCGWIPTFQRHMLGPDHGFYWPGSVPIFFDPPADLSEYLTAAFEYVTSDRSLQTFRRKMLPPILRIDSYSMKIKRAEISETFLTIRLYGITSQKTVILICLFFTIGNLHRRLQSVTNITASNLPCHRIFCLLH
jgi:hypothetical protein